MLLEHRQLVLVLVPELVLEEQQTSFRFVQRQQLWNHNLRNQESSS
jgi:hypothetical protein